MDGLQHCLVCLLHIQQELRVIVRHWGKKMECVAKEQLQKWEPLLAYVQKSHFIPSARLQPPIARLEHHMDSASRKKTDGERDVIMPNIAAWTTQTHASRLFSIRFMQDTQYPICTCL